MSLFKFVFMAGLVTTQVNFAQSHLSPPEINKRRQNEYTAQEALKKQYDGDLAYALMSEGEPFLESLKKEMPNEDWKRLIRAKGKRGEKPIAIAAFRGDRNAVKFLIEELGDPGELDSEDDAKRTPLMYARIGEGLRLAVLNKIPPETDEDLKTKAHRIVISYAGVRVLLHPKVSANKTDIHGLNELDYALATNLSKASGVQFYGNDNDQVTGVHIGEPVRDIINHSMTGENSPAALKLILTQNQGVPFFDGPSQKRSMEKLLKLAPGIYYDKLWDSASGFSNVNALD